VKRRRSGSGFTLLEVLIALAFVAIALVAVIRTQGDGIRLADQARFTSRALFLARTKLAEIESTRDLTSDLLSGRYEEPLDELGWDADLDAIPGLTGLYRARVSVFRYGDSPETGLVLEGIVYREEAVP